MKHVTFNPRGICAIRVDFDIDDEKKIRNLAFTGGCNGNLKAIGLLVEGKDDAETAEILRGNRCGTKSTSCADQFAQAIDQNI